MNVGEKVICYIVISLVLSIMTGGVAGVIMLWMYFAWELKQDADRKEGYRRYKECKRREAEARGEIYHDWM